MLEIGLVLERYKDYSSDKQHYFRNKKRSCLFITMLVLDSISTRLLNEDYDNYMNRLKIGANLFKEITAFLKQIISKIELPFRYCSP